MEFVIATNNQGKLKDFNLLLETKGHSAISLNSLDIQIEIEETGTTFLENAYIKAKTIYDITKKPTIADDSGLCVDALNGAPGVYSARYGGEGLTDKDRCEKLLSELFSVPDQDRTAHFTCAICAFIEEDAIIQVEGSCEGFILHELRGENGFGYDPLFYVPEFEKSFGELSNLEKNRFSHRKQAMDQFVKKLSIF